MNVTIFKSIINKSAFDNSPPPLLKLSRPQGQNIEVKSEKSQYIRHLEVYLHEIFFSLSCPQVNVNADADDDDAEHQLQ